MRLNKYIARCGVTSRRKADTYIEDGRVAVNGRIVTVHGVRIDPDDDLVQVDGREISLPDSYVYYLLHKPQNVISAAKDPHGRTTVVDLIPTSRRIYPMGRLDYDTTGVLLLTDDGDFANRLMHPSQEIPRTYQIEYAGSLPDNAAEQLSDGIDIGEEIPAKGELHIAHQQAGSGSATLTLRAGRYHEVKRIFAYFQTEVKGLHRVSFAGLECGNLKPGEYRRLTRDEIRRLQR